MCTKKRKTNAPVKNVQNVQHLDENVGWHWCEILCLLIVLDKFVDIYYRIDTVLDLGESSGRVPDRDKFNELVYMPNV
jgi:hypothetical protein